jgi:PAS domain S-box-containing protein
MLDTIGYPATLWMEWWRIMRVPELPPDEAMRLKALCSLDLLDTAPEPRFDRITRLAMAICEVPIALVSLVDADRQWFKSRQGLAATETPRAISFCGHAILEDGILLVPDAPMDPRFAGNPLVTGAPGIRFYAGAPIHAPTGERVGTLCVIDDRPRTLTGAQLVSLRDLADLVEGECQRTEMIQLARRERNLARVVEHTSHGVAIADAEGRLEWVNQGFERITGYPAAEVMGRKPGSFLQGPGTEDATVDYMRDCIRKGVPFEVEVQNHRKDGTPYWVDLKVQPVRDDQGRLTNFIAIQNDITLRRWAASQIVAGEKRMRAIVDNVVDGIITIDGQGIILTVNASVERIFGYGCAELLGRHVRVLLPESHREVLDRFLTRNPKGGPPKVLWGGRTAQGLRKDGRCFPMDLGVSGMEIDGVRMFTGIVRDISERVEAEARLHALTSMRQAILDSANLTIISTDPEGTIQTWNRAAERFLGYSAQEMVGKHDPSIIHDPEEVRGRARELSLERGRVVEPGFEVFVVRAREGEADEREWTYLHKDGSRMPVHLSVSALRGPGGEITGFLGIGMDLTERKRVEELKNEFISTVSHELRTPLTSIRGALGLVLAKAGALLPAKAKGMLELAERNCNRLTLLIDDLLDLEKIEEGRLEFQFEVVDLNALARKAMEDIEGFADARGVPLTLAPFLPEARVLGDGHRLLQVFGNLLSNAIKFSPRGEAVEVAVLAGEAGFKVVVQDHGSGIPVAFRDRVFQRFAQADGSITREKGGTGLGLCIAKVIVERHGGQIGYETGSCRGTRFHFELPVLTPLGEPPGASPL